MNISNKRGSLEICITSMFQKAVMGQMVHRAAEGNKSSKLLLCTHLGRTVALTLKNTAVLSTFLPREKFLDCLKIPWEGQDEVNFQVSFSICSLRCILSAHCAFLRSLKGHRVFLKESKEEREVNQHAWFVKILFLVIAKCQCAWPSPLAYSTVKDSERKVNFQVH